MHSLLSIMLCFSPVTSIYLGELVPPINALKLKLGEPAPSEGAFLSASDWISIKTTMENTVSVCEWAVSEAVSVCLDDCEQRHFPELDLLRDTVISYELMLSELKTQMTRSEKQRKMYMWGALSASSLALLSFALWSIR